MFGFGEARKRWDMLTPFIVVDEHIDLRGICLVPGSLTFARSCPVYAVPRLGHDEDGAGAGLPRAGTQVLPLNAQFAEPAPRVI